MRCPLWTNHVRQRRASGLWLQPAHRRELPEGIRGIFSKEDEDTGTGGALHFTNNRQLEKRQTEKAFPVLQVIGSVAQRAVQCFFSRSHLNFSLEMVVWDVVSANVYVP